MTNITYEAAYDIDVKQLDPEARKKEVGKSIADQAMELQTSLFEKLEAITRKYAEKSRSLATSHKEFIDSYNQKKREMKPLSQITIINYDYNPAILTQVNSKIASIFPQLLNLINTSVTRDKNQIMDEKNLLNSESEEFEKYLVNQIGLTAKITKVSQLNAYVKKIFRGEKKEMTLKASEINTHLTLVGRYRNVINNGNRYLKQIQDQMKSLSEFLTNVANSPSLDDKSKRKLLIQGKSIYRVLLAYTNFMDLSMSLQIERIYNSRIIINKFYDKK